MLYSLEQETTEALREEIGRSHRGPPAEDPHPPPRSRYHTRLVQPRGIRARRHGRCHPRSRTDRGHRQECPRCPAQSHQGIQLPARPVKSRIVYRLFVLVIRICTGRLSSPSPRSGPQIDQPSSATGMYYYIEFSALCYISNDTDLHNSPSPSIRGKQASERPKLINRRSGGVG